MVFFLDPRFRPRSEVCCGDEGVCMQSNKCCCLMSSLSIDKCTDFKDDKGAGLLWMGK